MKYFSESSIKMPFLWTIPTTMMAPMKDEMFSVVRVRNRASRAPEPQRIVAIRMAIGCEKERNSNTSMMKIRRIDIRRTCVRPRNDSRWIW